MKHAARGLPRPELIGRTMKRDPAIPFASKTRSCAFLLTVWKTERFRGRFGMIDAGEEKRRGGADAESSPVHRNA